MAARVTINEAEMRAITGGSNMRAALERLGEQVAERAAQAAPKDTGAGAASIRAEVESDGGGDLVARVSWDQDHFYMRFHELGTSRRTARPFLRPALEGRYRL